MTRRFASRYWSSLTGQQWRLATPQPRGRAGYSFSRRYLAALLGISLPPRPAPPRRSSEHAVAFAAPPASPPPQAEFRQALRVRPRHGWALAMGIVAISTLAVSVTFFAAREPAYTGSPPGTEPPFTETLSNVDPVETAPQATESGPQELPRPPLLSFGLGSETSVPRCGILGGPGALPRVGAAVLLFQEPGTTATYFGGRLKFGGYRWRANVVLGTLAGQVLELGLYAVTPEVADAMASFTGEPLPEVPGPPFDTVTVTTTEASC